MAYDNGDIQICMYVKRGLKETFCPHKNEGKLKKPQEPTT